MKRLSPIAFVLVLLVACLAPSLALAEGIGNVGGFVSSLFGEFDTAAIVAVLGAVGGVALAFSKFLPGWGTKLNVVAVVAAAMASAVGALGPKAGGVAIIVAAFGAWTAYNRSEKRAAGTPEARERIAELQA